VTAILEFLADLAAFVNFLIQVFLIATAVHYWIYWKGPKE